MVRDFSKAKKEELYRALDLIDDREWKPFMAWCGGRTAEFGEWAERLSISTYTRQIDNYQNRVLEVNDSTRNQIDITFEGVAETDRRYAQIFRGHAEAVQGQIALVQAMVEAMRGVNNSGVSDSNNNRTTCMAKKVIQQCLKNVSSGSDFTDFLHGNPDINYGNCIEELDIMYSEGHFSDREYQYFKSIINIISSGRVPGIMVEEIRKYLEKEYEKVLQENQVLDTYITEDVLKELGWDIQQVQEVLGEDFIERLRISMMQAGIANEDSVKLFLITVSHESAYGTKMLEIGNEKYFEEKESYTINTRGAGLIQVTGSSQYDLIVYLIEHTSDETEKNNLIVFRDNYTDLKEKCDNLARVDNMSASEYIAANYSVESAVWYWGYYKGRITIQGEAVSINECIMRYDGKTDLETFFVATQCVVNGSEFIARGLGRLFNPENNVTISDNKVVLRYYDDGKNHTATSYLPNGWENRKRLYKIMTEL